MGREKKKLFTGDSYIIFDEGKMTRRGFFEKWIRFSDLSFRGEDSLDLARFRDDPGKT